MRKGLVKYVEGNGRKYNRTELLDISSSDNFSNRAAQLCKNLPVKLCVSTVPHTVHTNERQGDTQTEMQLENKAD